MARTLLAILPLLGLAACATAGDFPSLAPRPIEQLSMEEPVRDAPVVPTDTALRGRAQGLLAEVQRGDAAFEAAYGRALPAVRSAGGRGSDSWINAQQAISRIEAAREPSAVALANLDRLVADRLNQSTNTDDEAELQALLAEAVSISDDQQRRIDALRSQIGGP